MGPATCGFEATESTECFTWVVSTTAKTDTSIEPYTLYACSATGGQGTLLTRDPAWPDPTTPAVPPPQATSATPAPPPESSKSSTNLGAIIGGAVGGGAGLGLIGLAAFLIMRRKKKSDAAAAQPDSTFPQPMSPTSPDGAYANAAQPGYQYGPLPPQPGALQPNYDPNMAYNGQAYQQYPPQQQYGGYAPQQVYAANLPASSSTSPPPVSPNSPQPSELNANAVPLGAESNRAELPSS
ncbi:hypothetical protein ESCO_000894 [Escovopsis weberi]|uniref:Carcinoembryonic antigen-related cell adhesion molecule 1 n=1 Tax=Escovopsis weberi TaxID=150374 RepID=A0A0M8N2M9_ESCWE|nr:hypothetical protein ESCO_000894 [Escovopsis weberi]